MKIEVVETFEEFVELEPVWKELFEKSGSDNPFITYEFFYCLIKIFFKKNELLIFIVKEAEEVVGIAPFYREGISIKSINNIHSHYFDFILKKYRIDVYDHIFRYIFKNYKFKNLILGDVSKDSGLFKYIISDSFFIYSLIQERVSPILMVNGDWDDFYSSISRNFRNNVNKRVNKVNRQGGYLLKQCSDKNELDNFLSDLFVIEEKSWKHLLGRSMLRNHKQPAFYSLLSEVFFENIEIDILYISNRPSAFWFSIIYNDSIYQLKNSFVEEMKDLSPGIILTVECLKNYFNRNPKCIDYLGVTNTVKSRVSNGSVVACNILVLKKTPLNQIYIYLKIKLWPKIGDSNIAQRLKNFLLRKSTEKVEKVNRKTLLKK